MADVKPINPFVIDTARLDLEWARQPKLSRDSGVAEADARHDFNRAKARVAVREAELAAVKAQLYLSIRADPITYGLREKPTVDEVEAAVLVHKNYTASQAVVYAAVHEQIDAQRDLDMAEANRIAITHDRRKALENYVELLAMDYVCEREPAPLSEGARRNLRNRRSDFGEAIDDRKPK